MQWCAKYSVQWCIHVYTVAVVFTQVQKLATVQCAVVYTVQCTVCSVLCAVCCVLCAVCCVQLRIQYNVYTVCSCVQYAVVYSVQCIYSFCVPCAL